MWKDLQSTTNSSTLKAEYIFICHYTFLFFFVVVCYTAYFMVKCFIKCKTCVSGIQGIFFIPSCGNVSKCNEKKREKETMTKERKKPHNANKLLFMRLLLPLTCAVFVDSGEEKNIFYLFWISRQSCCCYFRLLLRFMIIKSWKSYDNKHPLVIVSISNTGKHQLKWNKGWRYTHSWQQRRNKGESEMEMKFT